MPVLDYLPSLPTKKQALVYCGIGVTSVILTPVVIAAAGFGAGGVVAGSVAAGVQSTIGNVAAGSVFASLQSAGVLGVAGTTKGVILATGSAAVPTVKKTFAGAKSVCSWVYSRSGIGDITAEGALKTMRAAGAVGLAATAQVVNAVDYVGRNAVAPAVGATCAGAYHATSYIASRL